MTSNNNIEQREFLEKIKKTINPEILKGKIESIKDIKVLVIGDSIIDEYAFCDNIERAKKEPILVFQYKNSEHYAGGVLAIANHVAEYSDNVAILTLLGNDELSNKITGEKLNPKIQKNIFSDNKYPTLTKKRYIEAYHNHKMFEVYNKEHDLVDLSESKIADYLEEHLEDFDLVIVADFGHGLISDRIKDILCQKAKYLAVNVQTNSGNLGFNVITKFKRADFISLTIEELQLALQDKRSDLKDLVERLSNLTNCRKINITRGKNGIFYFNNGEFYQVPIFSEEVVDTTGAGDAVFSLVSMLSLRNHDPILIPFLGNCIGALAVKILGNRKTITSEELMNFTNKLLKS